MVEHHAVDVGVVGSSPTALPKILIANQPFSQTSSKTTISLFCLYHSLQVLDIYSASNP